MTHKLCDLPYGDYDDLFDEEEYDDMDAKVRQMNEKQFKRCCDLLNDDYELWCIGDAIDYVLGYGDPICQINEGEMI